MKIDLSLPLTQSMLENLKSLFKHTQNRRFQVHIYPLNLAEANGLPCRIIAEL